MLYFYTDIWLILSLISKRNLKRFFTLLLLLAFWFYRQNEDIQYIHYALYNIHYIPNILVTHWAIGTTALYIRTCSVYIVMLVPVLSS